MLMHKPKHSIRFTIGLVVLLLGLSGILLSAVTGHIYQTLLLDRQKEAFKSFAERKAGFIQTEIVTRTTELGLSAQATQGFRKAMASKDTALISAQLDERFRSFYVSTKLVDLESLHLLDLDFNVIGRSFNDEEHQGEKHEGEEELACPIFLSEAQQRVGASRLKVVSELCVYEDDSVIAVLIPVGGIRLKGYLLAVVDPSHSFLDMEVDMGIPLVLHDYGSGKTYDTDSWPVSTESDQVLVWEYILMGSRNIPAYNFKFASDISGLQAQINDTRTLLLSAATVVTLLFILISLFILRRTMLLPLETLKKHLLKIKKDKSLLGKEIHVEGNIEMYDLAEGFNSMSMELHDLYGSLEDMAFTDTLTGLPNRALFNDRIEQAARNARRNNMPYALMVLDLNKFKIVNDTLGHHVGDELLCEVAKRLKSCVRESDTIARIGGDEFAVILNDAGVQKTAIVVAKKMIERVGMKMLIEGHTVDTGISVGIALYSKSKEDSETLLRQADAAMYHAKKNDLGYMCFSDINKPSSLDAFVI